MFLRNCSAAATREVEENGLFLGSFPKATYSSVEVPFSTGDWCLLYTDGVLEMTNPSQEEFGKDRLRLFLESSQGLGADQFVDSLLDELWRWSDRASGREPEDDVTLAAIHSKGPE